MASLESGGEERRDKTTQAEGLFLEDSSLASILSVFTFLLGILMTYAIQLRKNKQDKSKQRPDPRKGKRKNQTNIYTDNSSV